MTLIPICRKCKTKLETAMFEVETEKPSEFRLLVHLEYCARCREYKGHDRNFPKEQERGAVLNQFESTYKHVLQSLGKVLGYETRIPLRCAE